MPMKYAPAGPRAERGTGTGPAAQAQRGNLLCMGCGGSSGFAEQGRYGFVPNDKRPGQGMEAQQDFAKLGCA